MKIALLAFLLSFYSLNLYAADCGGTCATSTDCTGQCKFCPGTPDGCSNCCDAPDQETCDLQSPCIFTNGECRNIATLPCSAGVSEIGENTSKSVWIILALFISVIVPSVMIWKNQRNLAKK